MPTDQHKPPSSMSLPQKSNAIPGADDHNSKSNIPTGQLELQPLTSPLSSTGNPQTEHSASSAQNTSVSPALPDQCHVHKAQPPNPGGVKPGSLDEAPSEQHAVLAGHRETTAIICRLIAQLQAGTVDTVGLLGGLKSAERSLAAMITPLGTMIEDTVYQEYCPPHALGLAQRVFDIPELLEMILDRLSIRGILLVQIVNRQFRDAVKTSTVMQRELYLLPHVSKNVSLHPEFRNLDFRLTTQVGLPGSTPEDDDDPEEFYSKAAKDIRNRTLSIAINKLWLPEERITIQPTVRRMLIVQPPIYEMGISSKCCVPAGDEGHFRVVNDNGITFGDLEDATAKLEKDHMYCRHAPRCLISSEDGSVDVRAEFRTRILLDVDDPMARAHKLKLECAEERARKSRMNRRMLKDFLRAKRECRCF